MLNGEGRTSFTEPFDPMQLSEASGTILSFPVFTRNCFRMK